MVITRHGKQVAAVARGRSRGWIGRARGRLEGFRGSIDANVLPAITVLAYSAAVARTYGEIDGHLHRLRLPLVDADLQIAATALHHGLELVTGNIRHFERIPGLSLVRVLADARR